MKCVISWHGFAGAAQQRHDPPPSLPVAASEGGLFGSPLRRVCWVASPAPLAPGRHRALGAAGRPGGAHGRPKLHRGGVKDLRLGRCLGEQRGHIVEITGTRHTGGGPSVHDASKHAPGIGVDYRMPLAKRKYGDRAGGIGPHAGQAQEGVEVAWHRIVVLGGDLAGSAVEPEGAARVAEPIPRPHRLARCLGGKAGGNRPAFDPREIPRHHPVDLSLLQHELGDQHVPGGDPRATPGKRAGLACEPGPERLGKPRESFPHRPAVLIHHTFAHAPSVVSE